MEKCDAEPSIQNIEELEPTKAIVLPKGLVYVLEQLGMKKVRKTTRIF